MLPPYNTENAIYILVEVVRDNGTKCVRGAVWAENDIPGGTEIICDYHWYLEGKVFTDPVSGKRILLTHGCPNCVDMKNVLTRNQLQSF